MPCLILTSSAAIISYWMLIKNLLILGGAENLPPVGLYHHHFLCPSLQYIALEFIYYIKNKTLDKYFTLPWRKRNETLIINNDDDKNDTHKIQCLLQVGNWNSLFTYAEFLSNETNDKNGKKKYIYCFFSSISFIVATYWTQHSAGSTVVCFD